MKPILALLLLLLCLAFSGCVSNHNKVIPDGELVFYLRNHGNHFRGYTDRKAGFYYYLNGLGTIDGYEYRRGRVVRVIEGTAESSKKLQDKISSINLCDFEYEAAVEQARANWREERRIELQQQREKPRNILSYEKYTLGPVQINYKFEICSRFEGNEFRFITYKIFGDLSMYPQRSAEWKSLSDWIEAFSSFSGIDSFDPNKRS